MYIGKLYDFICYLPKDKDYTYNSISKQNYCIFSLDSINNIDNQAIISVEISVESSIIDDYSTKKSVINLESKYNLNTDVFSCYESIQYHNRKSKIIILKTMPIMYIQGNFLVSRFTKYYKGWYQIYISLITKSVYNTYTENSGYVDFINNNNNSILKINDIEK